MKGGIEKAYQLLAAVVVGYSKMEDTKTSSSNTTSNDHPPDCPLFMNDLGGTNFANNTGLAALASLLNDNVEEEVVEGSEKSSSNNKKKSQSQPKLKSGGGKVKKPTGKRNNHTPYSKEKTKDDDKKKSASLGEAQLFMNMWKI